MIYRATLGEGEVRLVFAIRHTYGVDIAAGEDWLLLLACVLALDLADDREHRDN